MDHRRVVLARTLVEAGLWDHAPAEVRAAEQARIAEGGYPFADDALEETVFNADGEDLAEGGAERFLAKLAPALRQHGLQLQVRTVQDPYRAADPDPDYVLEINGVRCTIWEQDEWERGDPWEEATLRPLVVVNVLLEKAHSAVRVFTLYAGGNDGLVLLLDRRVPAAMRASGLFPDSEIPSLPIAEGRPETAGPEHPPTGAALARRPGSWAVLGAYVALVAASHVLWISFASVSGRAALAFHTTEVSIGLLVAVGPLCSAALSIPGGVVADRYGYRTPLLWAGLATSVFAFLRPLAGGFPVLLVLTIGLLLPQPLLINAVADLVNRHFPEQEAATATGLGTTAIFLGITLGLVATPGLVAALGVRGSQVTFAAVSLAALGAFWRLTPRPVPDRLVAPEELSVRQALARVLRSGTQWKLSAALFLGFGLYLGITTWLEEMLRPRGIDEAGAGLVAGTITIAGVVGSVMLGAASDRIRRRKPFLMVAGAAAAPTLWLLGQLRSLAGLIGVAFTLGFFLLAALPIAIAVASEDRSLGPQVGSTAVGVMLLAGNLGGAAVVIGMGALKSASGDFHAAVALISALAVIVALIAFTIPDPLRQTDRA